jgi:hypothetical protein
MALARWPAVGGAYIPKRLMLPPFTAAFVESAEAKGKCWKIAGSSIRKPVVVVLDQQGKLSAATLDELKAEFANDTAFAPLIAGSKASGGGAAGAGGGGGAAKGKIGGTKEERTAEFDSVPTDYDIYLDNTPIRDASGNYNFPNVKWDWRPGSVDQTYIPGIPSVENETSLNIELRSDSPWVRPISNT